MNQAWEGVGIGLGDQGWIQSPVPGQVGLPQGPWICACDFTCANLSNPIGVAVVQHSVRRNHHNPWAAQS